MAELNQELMRIFPDPDELPAHIQRGEALVFIRRILEASRASIDEVTERSQKVLTEDEVIRLHRLGEQMHALATEAGEYKGPNS
jgi:hypothetical protein